MQIATFGIQAKMPTDLDEAVAAAKVTGNRN
jgi:hypothetical protein